MNAKAIGHSKHHRGMHRPRVIVAAHPHSVPIPDADLENGPETDRPFEEGAHDVIDPDLRHRMISEAAYSLYAQRGYADGFDVDDWLTAEAEVDHILLERETG